MNEVRISPDGKSVAIRTDFPAGSWNEFGVMTAANGGHFASAEDVAEWPVATVPAPEPEPEPEDPAAAETNDQPAKKK